MYFPAQTDSRFRLLENGSTPLIRNIAAQQLGDVQKAHPDELFHLLAKVLPYLKSRSWDTRTAAAKALGGIVENAERFNPNADVKKEEEDDADLDEDVHRATLPSSQERLNLETLDISAILTNGQKLLGSGNKEHDDVVASMDHTVWLEFQKRIAPIRLGLRGPDIDGAITEVLQGMHLPEPSQSSGKGPSTLPKVDTSDSMMLDRDNARSASPYTAMSPPPNSAQTPTEEAGLSKRQLNQLKRKKKMDAKSQASKVRVVDLSANRRLSTNTPLTPSTTEPFAVKPSIKEDVDADGDTDMFSLKRENVDEDAKIVSDFKGIKIPDLSIIQTVEEEEGLEWPYERLCEVLEADLFDQAWEIRHGAAMALREIVRVHGAGAGRIRGKSSKVNDVRNEEWLNDLACRLCSVLMLDRFGDYISDNVVAPIRETIGQTLGALLVHIPPRTVTSVYRVLYRMVMQQKDLAIPMRIWEVCHGGMIGLRYLVAVRNDLLVENDELMDGVVEAVMKGLADFDDDVRAVSAATLIPIAKDFVTIRPAALPGLMKIVWDCLSDLRDDLSASTGFVMDLLAKLCSFPQGLEAMKLNAKEDGDQTFDKLVPRLYPFLRHTITTVRAAVLRALQTFLGINDSQGWVDGRILRLLFQNLLVERNENALSTSLNLYVSLLKVLRESGRLENELSGHLEDMKSLALHPIGTSRNSLPIPLCHMVKPSGHLYGPRVEDQPKLTQQNGESGGKHKKRKKEEEPPPATHNVDGHMLTGEVDLVGSETLVRSRIYAAGALGRTLASLPNGDCRKSLALGVSSGLKSPYSTTQTTSALIVEEAARHSGGLPEVVREFSSDLSHILDDPRPDSYNDIVSYLRIVRAQCYSLISAFREHGRVPESRLPNVAALVQGDADGPYAFRMSNADSIVGNDYDRLKRTLAPAQRFVSTQILSDARTTAIEAMDEAKKVKGERDTRIRAAAAGALVAIGEIPKKPTNLIKAIMDSIKLEENSELQKRSAAAIASLLDYYATTQKWGPANKIITNLTSFYCVDTSETPEFGVNAAKHDVILSLHKEEDRKDFQATAEYEKEARSARITRRGTKEALDQLCQLFGTALFEKAPVLKNRIESPLDRVFGSDTPIGVGDGDEAQKAGGQEVVDSFSILRALVPAMHADLSSFTIQLIPFVAKALRHQLSVIRYAAAKCFATICNVLRIEGMTTLVQDVLPHIGSDDVHCRQGVIELIYHLIHVMEDSILPYVIFLIVPVLGRMSDSDSDVRLIATTTFATLVKLVPLEAGIQDPPGFPETLLKGRDRERKFMAQMLDFKKVEEFHLPVAIKAELRSYQQEGVNWLAFLNRYNLHGILCDDMGLGKTLQTLCIVASDHHMRAEEYAKTQASDSRKLPSLIICPPTLSGHWQQEIKQFAPFLTCLAYVGPSADRQKLRSQIGMTDIVITSYDICRNDNDVFTPLNWNYCVLDEGHLIKNPKAKTSMAVKKLNSNHRLILSGTPIQNNVLELWSLFDFLMPGFLGTEKVFLDRFARPIAASRFSKSSSKEQEAGALAIEALHKQVLPFLLRRLKEEVLNDLPPKILQNYYCDLSDLQKRLFDDFAKKERKALADEAGSETKEAKQHIFQALQYMRKLCNSPALVVKEDHKQYAAIQQQLAKSNSSLKDITHAPKLTALRDLLVDCGIGTDSTVDTVAPHRALIFCQMKEMLDIVANTVLKELLPSVQYLRLDGSVAADKRQDIVNQFNTDPSYDCLLLTTSVGGLGLNLTGADTVIFVEHDWNPQKDMQAMDRAHRIGQKKVVNVYRLVTRGTLEEKILK